MNNKVFFSKSPLIEVIFEIRFDPNMSVACRREDFYNAIREEYPEVSFPQITVPDHPFIQPTQYINKEQGKIITCSGGSLSLSTRKYKGFHKFRDDCMKILDIFFEKYKTINKIKRIGFRYINHIQVEREEDKINLKKYLNYDFELPNILEKNKINAFRSSFFIELEEKTSGIKMSIDNIQNENGKDFIVLDFDLISLKEIKPIEIKDYIVKYHDAIEKIFLEITTSQYQDSIR